MAWIRFLLITVFVTYLAVGGHYGWEPIAVVSILCWAEAVVQDRAGPYTTS